MRKKNQFYSETFWFSGSLNLQLYSVGLMIDEIMVATFSVIESTIAVIVMVHTAIGTSEGIKLGEITEITRIEITLGKVEGPIAIGKTLRVFPF